MGFKSFILEYWVWFALALALLSAFYVYTKLDAYTKRRLSQIFNKRVLFGLGFVIGWYVWHKYGAVNMVSDANRWMPVFFMLFLAGTQFVEALKYQSQQFITPNFHGSYSKAPKYCNGFYIFAIDSFNAGGLAWDYAGRIAIVREETVELFLEGSLSIANMGFVSKYELDDDVRKLIESNKFLKGAQDKIYYGWFDDIERVDWEFQKLKQLADEHNDPKNIYNMVKKELNVGNPTVKTLLWMYKNQCKATTKQTEQFDATVEAVEKGVEHNKRVKDAYMDKQESGYKVEGGHEEY